MVVCQPDHTLQADVVFVIEGTAVNGAYILDLKTNYIVPSLEYFSQGNLDDNNYLSEHANSLYGIVVYQAADCLPHLSTDTIGPFTSASKVTNALDKLELIGGKGESCANIGEGLATALHCFEELQQRREANTNTQKHCILICNSPPYLLPVMESQTYAGKTGEQLATILQERGINLSIISPRKIPSLYKLFEKAGGDLNASQTKNYAKDPRHLVLLKGYSLKERPISPPVGTASTTQAQIAAAMPITSLPSPLQGNDSPISVINPISQHQQNIVNPGMVNVNMLNQQRPGMVPNQQFPNQQIQAPPGYHNPTGMAPNRPPTRWPMMPPQPQPQRPFMPQPQPSTQGSALIAQLSQPPSSMSGNVNQFGQMTNAPGINVQQQQQPLRINLLNPPPNVQPPLQQNQPNMQNTSNPAQVSSANQAITSQAQGNVQQKQQLTSSRERHTIWHGSLEWIEKPKNPSDPQKVTKHVPCQVSATSKDGEPELKADGWPTKLIMQLMPKQLIGSIGGIYLKNSKSVLFHPQQCEALDSLTKVMSSGFAGCVHFTSNPNPNTTCDIKVLILLYTSDKRAYIGFIPNDQSAFVDRLRTVIQQQKSTQMMRQGQGGAPNMNPQAGVPMSAGNQLPCSNPATSQTPPQQPLMMSQTNTIAMGGGQITQNVVNTNNQPGSGMGVLNQNVPSGAMQTRLRMPQGMQQGNNQLNQQVNANASMGQGMMGAPVQRAPFENQLQVERQQNLEKINQLKQTLEAAQQQEQQYKNQLERISHMKTSQLQEALNLAQQQEMHYKMLDQQRLGAQPNQQAANAQQQRMMRPSSNNPGLRHLLQQQPFRQQMINMQQMTGNPQRPQMGQQMPNTGNAGVPFEDNSFDFM